MEQVTLDFATNFQSFVSSIDFTSRIITLMISASIKDLLNELLDQFVSPITNKFMYKQDSKYSIYGHKINISKITNKIISVMVTLFIAFLIHKFLIKK